MAASCAQNASLHSVPNKKCVQQHSLIRRREICVVVVLDVHDHPNDVARSTTRRGHQRPHTIRHRVERWPLCFSPYRRSQPAQAGPTRPACPAESAPMFGPTRAPAFSHGDMNDRPVKNAPRRLAAALGAKPLPTPCKRKTTPSSTNVFDNTVNIVSVARARQLVDQKHRATLVRRLVALCTRKQHLDRIEQQKFRDESR
jgi:hypothetical protein